MTGLQQLIDFVLNEVALCGNQGATLSEVLKAIDDFYRQTQDGPPFNQNIDRGFKVKVWSWLTSNPEVSVGRHNEWNHLTLDEAEQLDSQATASEELHGDESEVGEATDQNSHSSPLRIFVSEERIWVALTGHPPDETKVLPLEFVLLSIIASRKSEGIVQPELVRLSGQDKRSVPKRTSALHQKGYIDKRPVQTKKARTSLCTLQRYFRPSDKKVVNQEEEDSQSKAMIDFASFNTDLFNILREHPLIARADLKRLLGFNDPWRWKVLARALRKWERMGVVQRVRAESQYERMHPCVKLLRDPTERDLQLFHEFNFEAVSKHGMGARRPKREDFGDMELEGPSKRSASPEEEGLELVDDHVEPAERIVPSWTPDRNLYNQLFDIIERSGTSGITNHVLNMTCFGSFYKRPAEAMVHRLVDLWQVAQPLHLRHFSVVRDMAMKKTVMYYVNYSASNFAKLVEDGKASWEAVEFPAEKAKSLKIDAPPFGALPQLDEFGFPKVEFPRGLMKNANATLRDGVLAAKPTDYLLSSSDPFVVRLADGQYVIRTRTDKLPPGSKQQIEARTRQTGRTGRPKGRPNKATLAKRARENEAREAQAATSERAPEPEPKASEAYGWEDFVEPPPPTKRAKIKHQLRGLSEREKLEALGMDETWTEYNALIIDKPGPGIFVTPHGRRRPVGKSRGRPRQSRIAVFKSYKLASFPWFVADANDTTDDGEAGAAATSQEFESLALEAAAPVIKSESPIVTRSPIPVWPRERISSDGPTAHSPTPSSSLVASGSGNERPHKRPRLHEAHNGGRETSVEMANEVPPADRTPGHDMNYDEASRLGHHNKSASVHLLEDGQSQTPSKRPRLESPAPTQQSSTPRPSTVTAGLRKLQSNAGTQPAKETPRSRARTSRNAPNADAKEFEAPRPLIERGGSISILRRKLLMEIIEDAGGVYPGGAAIWYPFVTAWMKFHPTEKPDMRTIKNACKHLVSAGLLRQLTFSGRNKKHVTVTKTLLMKPDMPPDHPLVKEMQKKALSIEINEARPTFAENVELDPTLTRSGGRPHGAPPRPHRSSIPVEQEAQVHLQQKPAFVLNFEKRKCRSAQSSLFRRLAAQAKAAAAADELPDLPGVQRLMTLARPPELDTNAHPHTSIIRPLLQRVREPQKRKSMVHAKRVRMRPMSAIGAYGMLMNPVQHFHPVTGTFSTHLCLLQPKRSELILGAQPAIEIENIEESVNELSRLAHDEIDLPEVSRMKRFDIRTKRILEWELLHQNLFDMDLKGQEFINQTIQHKFKTSLIEGDIRFDVITGPPQAAPAGPAMPTRRSEALRLRQSVPGSPTTFGSTEAPATQQPKRRRKRASRAAPSDRRLAKLDDITSPSKESQQPKRIRRTRIVRPVSEDLKKRLMIALVAVRVLAGGEMSRVIEWGLVSKAFPNHDSDFIQGRARQILSKNRLQITKMHRDFQECFLEGYENDEVPRIDYSDLEGYDWSTLVEWASQRLDISSSERVPDLPATREQFDAVFELREDPITAGDDLYQAVHGVTINHKRNLMARSPFAVPLEDEARPKSAPRGVDMAQLEAAKTWVRANIITAEETYRPNESSDILALFGDRLITSATQGLINERVISSTNRGRVSPGRNYDISDNFLQTLSRKRAVESTQLRRAVHFKSTILDPKLRMNGIFDIEYTAEDGDILALINLYASNAIQLRPRDPPRNKFGLTDGGYETRQMDKKRFRFPIEVIPTKKYRYGNPVHAKAAAVSIPPPPSAAGTRMPPRIPLWYDINGEFVHRLWDLVVGPVIGCLVTRPGIKAQSISNMIKPTMGAWETVLMLQWLEAVGVVKSDGEGELASWRLEESWWMILS
ncbi:B-block binding subunit of TFIIIC [Penicillium bovifimosum]|uniref:B-block binding subunit of TFIIIC n=1 Tax=Penicillium bovifimosum TaxID=126998 RepID=A0A9W9GJT1_9EURO|nr:B-block binding subunit of TFIIIC [Penicillium bovifimosum]KAJ5121570.1 B-block binding subunit of TFIIIC [Penicillium bovifimosum]